MKRSKAVNVTKGYKGSNVTVDRSYCYNYISENYYTRQITPGTIRNYKGVDSQNVSNWSHLTCSCENSSGNYQKASYFANRLKQMQLKSFNDIGVGSVKAFQKRKIKRVYLPETEERAVETLDLSLCENPKCQYFHGYNECRQKTSRNMEEKVINSKKKVLLHKKLSPLIQTKSNYTNPLSGPFCINENDKTVVNNPESNQINATTQVDARVLGKSQKIKIFKELAVNTETTENEQKEKSEIDLSDDMSRALYNKNGIEFASSLDSLIQHVYNLDKPCNGTVSQTSIDPMENKLEREYRKIFSSESRDCPCNNKLSTTNSDSLLRRFEALRRDARSRSRRESIKDISKISSHLNEPSYKDVSLASDPPTLQSHSYADRENITPLSSSIYQKDYLIRPNKKKSIITKLQSTPHGRPYHLAESDQGIKGMFKLWGKKLSLEDGSFKKSRFKFFDTTKKSEGNIRLGKPSYCKSADKKERKKFHFFKRKIKDDSKASKIKVLTGRCEINKGLTIKIGKGYSKQDQHAKIIKKIRAKHEDLLCKEWLQTFLSKSFESKKSLTVRENSSIYSSHSVASEIRANNSHETNILLYSNATTKTTSLHKVNKSPLVDFSRHYIQAWMMPKTTLDRCVKSKVYWNVESDKYNKKKKNDVCSKCLIAQKEMSSSVDKAASHNGNNLKEVLQSSSERGMVDIYLGCLNEITDQSYMHQQSNEEVYNIIDYETPVTSDVLNEDILNPDLNKGNLAAIDILNNSLIKDLTNCMPNYKVLKKNEESYNPDILQDNLKASRDAVGVGLITQNDKRDLKYPIYLKSLENDNHLKESFYIPPKNSKHVEIYLRKLCQNGIPLGVDLHLWTISDSILHHSFNSNNKEGSFNDVRYTTIVSSCEASANTGQDELENKEVHKYLKTILKKHKHDPLTEIGIRIQPKDSLEVLKKRKLYSNSNKGKWRNDNVSLSISNSKTKMKLKNRLPKNKLYKRDKKRVTISEYDVVGRSGTEFSLPNVIQAKSEKNTGLPSLACPQTTSESINNNNIINSENKLRNENETSQLQLINLSPTQNSASALLHTEDDNIKNVRRPSKDHIKFSTESLIMEPKSHPHPNNSCKNNHINTFDISNETITKLRLNCECLKSGNIVKNRCQNVCGKFVLDKTSSSESLKNVKHRTKKKCFITTDVQKISSLSRTSISLKKHCCHDLDIGQGKVKLSGLHFKKQPIKRNVSRACWTIGDKYDSATGDSVNNMKRTPSSKDINEFVCMTDTGVNEDRNSFGFKENKRKNKNTSSRSQKQPSQICTISVPGLVKNIYLENKSNHDKHNDTDSETDFVDINFKIRRKQGDDRTKLVNIIDSSERDKRNEKKLLRQNSEMSNNKELYLVHNASNPSILYRNYKNYLTIKILIKGCNQIKKINKKIIHNDQFSSSNIISKKVSEKLQTVSSIFNKSEDQNSYSLHKFTIDLTNSVEKNESNNHSSDDFMLLEPYKSETVKCEKEIFDEENVGIDKQTINLCGLGEEVINSQIQHDISVTKNYKLYFSNTSISPYTNYNVSKKTMSFHKKLKKKIIHKILECANDTNKTQRKEKIKEARKALRALLLSEYTDKSNIGKDTGRISGQLTCGTLTSIFSTKKSLCHVYSTKCSRGKRSNVKIGNYFHTVTTKRNKYRKHDTKLILKQCKRKKSSVSKMLRKKLGLTDLRICELISSQGLMSLKTNGNEIAKKMSDVVDYYNENQNLMCLSSNVIEKLAEKSPREYNFNLKSYCADEIQNKEQQVSQDNSIRNLKFNKSNNVHKLRIKRLNRSAILRIGEENKITIVNSNFVETKHINFHQSRSEQTLNKYTNNEIDILQLPEIKRGVLELYNAAETLSNNSVLLAKLPKFVSEVENVMI